MHKGSAADQRDEEVDYCLRKPIGGGLYLKFSNLILDAADREELSGRRSRQAEKWYAPLMLAREEMIFKAGMALDASGIERYGLLP